MAPQPQQFYEMTGPLSSLNKHRHACADLPDDAPSLCKIIQSTTLHIFWAERMGFPLSEQRQAEVQIRSVEKKLDRLFELDPSPLQVERPLAARLVVNCRDISLILAALLKAKGIPARARCGFATYFTPGKYEDHWVTEYWQAGEQRWCMMDAQLDDFQKEALKIHFDTLDMPVGKFIPAGRAWQLVRLHKADARKFGIFQYKGEMFIVGNLQRDLLALNSVELLPWDLWGFLDKRFVQLTPGQIAFLDEMAVITQLGDAGFELAQNMLAGNEFLHPHAAWLC